MSLKQGINPFAVIVGLTTAVIGSVATGLVLVIAMAASGIPDNELLPRIHTFSGLMLRLIGLLGFTFIGGYFAAQMAGQSHILHAGAVAGLGLFLSLLCWEPGLPLWYGLLHFGGMVPAGLMGGYIAKNPTPPADQDDPFD
jgi:hypothetical protein